MHSKKVLENKAHCEIKYIRYDLLYFQKDI